MNALKNVFSGRVIFDHLFKTAGQSINQWLIDSLGDGCVTPNLNGNHTEIIKRYGGSYSVISGHIAFRGEGMDPRYQYVSCLRDPIDRVLSTLNFIVNNHDEDFFKKKENPSELAMFYQAKDFIESEGDLMGPQLSGVIENHYVVHFSRILSNRYTKISKLDLAKSAIDSYDLIGFYDDLYSFVENFSSLLGFFNHADLHKINVGINKTPREKTSKKMLQKIESINLDDYKLYEHAKNNYAKREKNTVALKKPVTYIQYSRFKEAQQRIACGFNLIRFSKSYDVEVMPHSNIIFRLEVKLLSEVYSPVWGIHIFDEDGDWAFGVNSEMLHCNFTDLDVGHHCIEYELNAPLNSGNYIVGFALLGMVNGVQTEIAWFDSLAKMRVKERGKYPGIGYLNIPARIIKV
jgi:hypothetical protein